MKNKIGFLLPLLCLNIGILSSCGNDQRILLSFGDMHANDVYDVTISDIDSKVTNKESFLLTISSNTCACWAEDFHPVIKNYISNNHVPCLNIKYNDFYKFAHMYDIFVTEGTTTFVIFSEGVAKIKLQSNKSNNTMKDINDFNKFMSANIKLPRAYFINEQDIDNIITSKKSAVIYYERTKCGDCTYLNPSILANYLKSHESMNKLYVLDCQPWKLLDTDSYQKMKDKYGISSENNPKYGANIGEDKGVFPYFSYIKNGNFESGAVAFNDKIEKQNNEYVVIDSYYTEERLNNLQYLVGNNNIENKIIKGIKIPQSDIIFNGETASWSKDKAVKYYEPIIDAFLDYSLPNVNW